MNHPIRLIMVGCGYISQSEHVPSLLSLQPEIVVEATVDPVMGRAIAVAAPFKAKAFSSLKDAFSSVESDAVIILTPAPTHSALVCEAAAMGKPILLEKPLAYSLQEARQAIKAVGDAGVKCMLAYHRRYDDDCLRVRELLAGGAIGRIRAAVSLCKLVFPSYYRRYAEVVPPRFGPTGQDLPSDWLTENSIHHINLLRFWLGDVVHVHSALYRERDHNLGIVTLEFPNGILASHHQLRGMDCGEEITIYGESGNIKIDLWYPHRPYTFPRITQFTVQPPSRQEIVLPRTSPYTNEIGHFVKYIRGESDTRSDMADSYRDLEVMKEIIEKAAYIGAASGKEKKS
jgi:predicted dehydrogenase